jgi:hypothetical protein
MKYNHKSKATDKKIKIPFKSCIFCWVIVVEILSFKSTHLIEACTYNKK